MNGLGLEKGRFRDIMGQGNCDPSVGTVRKIDLIFYSGLYFGYSSAVEMFRDMFTQYWKY